MIQEDWWVLRRTEQESQWQWTANRGKKWYNIPAHQVYPRQIRDFIFFLFRTKQLKHIFAEMDYNMQRHELYIYGWQTDKDKEYKPVTALDDYLESDSPDGCKKPEGRN